MAKASASLETLKSAHKAHLQEKQRRGKLGAETMTRFRPCIDLHQGQVKQVVGGSFRSGADQAREDEAVTTNFVSQHGAAHFAQLYRQDQLTGGHVIQLGPGNEQAASEALAAWPKGLQLGGGVTPENASQWLERGASAVIVTSALFDEQGQFLPHQLEAFLREVGKEFLVIDLSCRRVQASPDAQPRWQVAMKRWSQPTEVWVNQESLSQLGSNCSEFLIHAADVEGRQAGMDEELLQALGNWSTLPTTYAGGARNLQDLQLAQELSQGKVDVTIGSALDIFGGKGVSYEDCVAWNARI